LGDSAPRELQSTAFAGILARTHRNGTWPWGGPQYVIRTAGDPALEASASPVDSADTSEVATLQRLIENIPWSVAIIVALATLVVASLSRLVPAPVLVLWYALTVAQCGIRVGVYLRHRTAPVRTPKKWMRWMITLAAASGLTWGGFGLLFASQVPIQYQLLILIVLTCLAAERALSTLMILPNLFVVFAATALLPVVLYSLLGTHVQQGAALAVLLAIALQMRFSHRHRLALESRSRVEAERRQLRDELERKERGEIHLLRTRALLLGAMGHDLMHPVHGMRLMVEALRKNGAAAPLPRIADAMQASLDSLSRKLNTILNSARLDPRGYQPEPLRLPIQALLEKVVAENASSAHAHGLTLRYRKSSAWINADPLLMHSILDNLVDNAMRHAQGGRVLVGVRREGTRVRIEIWDSGAGIAGDELPKIFQDFYRIPVATGTTGYGMGLALVKEMAELMGGIVSVRSTPRKGSRFAISLPASQRTREDAGPQRRPLPR
jgi:signal transduction histidine kinase